MKRFGVLFALLLAVPVFLQGQDMPKDYQEVLSYLGRKGDFKDEVLKVNLPRNDLKVTVSGVETPTAFGFGGWIAMRKGDNGMDVMMGDLVLLEDEVNPVMSALLDNGLEVTALHNHFLWEQPRIFYMHVHGHGKAVGLSHAIKPALDLMGKSVQGTPAAAPSTASPLALNTGRLDEIIGHKGDVVGTVYKVVIGRDDLKITEMGARIDARMGLNTWAALIGTDEKAAIAGDVAMREGEVTPVLKALRKAGLNVVAIHHHMTGSRPMVIFLHYWGTGTAEQLARGFRSALNELGKGKPSEHHIHNDDEN